MFDDAASEMDLGVRVAKNGLIAHVVNDARDDLDTYIFGSVEECLERLRPLLEKLVKKRR